MKTQKDRIADYLHTCVHDNVGETRAYIDPDNIDFMADEISSMVTSSHWISVNERLPETDADYLAISRGQCYVVAWLNHWGVFYESDGPLNHSDITHWMHLPKPPQP